MLLDEKLSNVWETLVVEGYFSPEAARYHIEELERLSDHDIPAIVHVDLNTCLGDEAKRLGHDVRMLPILEKFQKAGREIHVVDFEFRFEMSIDHTEKIQSRGWINSDYRQILDEAMKAAKSKIHIGEVGFIQKENYMDGLELSSFCQAHISTYKL